MPAALPMALRVRFREYVGEGSSGRAAAARLKRSAAIGVRWIRRWREQGNIRPDAQGRPKGNGKLAPYGALLEELVAQDGDIILPELAGALKTATGVVAHSASIGRFFEQAWLHVQKKSLVATERLRARVKKHRLNWFRHHVPAMQVGVSETLCMWVSPCGFDGSFVEPFWI